MHSAYADSGHVVALTEQLNLLRSELVAEMRNEVWGCNHCAHCVDKAVAHRLDQVCTAPPQGSSPICGFFFFFVTLCVTPSITVYL